MMDDKAIANAVVEEMCRCCDDFDTCMGMGGSSHPYHMTDEDRTKTLLACIKREFDRAANAELKTYLVGFTCYQNKYGCECNLDTPEATKKRFEIKNGYSLDDYCHITPVRARSSQEARELAYQQQGATETETAREIWPEVEVIEEIAVGDADRDYFEKTALKSNMGDIYGRSDAILTRAARIVKNVGNVPDVLRENGQIGMARRLEAILDDAELIADDMRDIREIAWAYTEIDELPKKVEPNTENAQGAS